MNQCGDGGIRFRSWIGTRTGYTSTISFFVVIIAMYRLAEVRKKIKESSRGSGQRAGSVHLRKEEIEREGERDARLGAVQFCAFNSSFHCPSSNHPSPLLTSPSLSLPLPHLLSRPPRSRRRSIVSVIYVCCLSLANCLG